MKNYRLTFLEEIHSISQSRVHNITASSMVVREGLYIFYRNEGDIGEEVFAWYPTRFYECEKID